MPVCVTRNGTRGTRMFINRGEERSIEGKRGYRGEERGIEGERGVKRAKCLRGG